MALIYPAGLSGAPSIAGYINAGWAPEANVYGARITAPSSGTVTQLGFYGFVRDSVSTAFKIGLYNTSGTLLAQSTIAASTNGTPSWRDSGAISASVSAGDYFVLVSASTSSGAYGYASSGGAGSFATENYASAMAASESITADGDTGYYYYVRLDFTAGGGTNNQRGTTLGAG